MRAGLTFSTHLVKFPRLNSSCSIAEVWSVADRGRAVVRSKTSYTLARSNQSFIHIAVLEWKLHTHWSKPTLVDGLCESLKRSCESSLNSEIQCGSMFSLMSMSRYTCLAAKCRFLTIFAASSFNSRLNVVRSYWLDSVSFDALKKCLMSRAAAHSNCSIWRRTTWLESG